MLNNNTLQPHLQGLVNPPNASLTPDEAKASLGIANNIMEQFLPSLQQAPMQEMSQEQAQNEQEGQPKDNQKVTEKPDLTSKIDKMESDIEEIKKIVSKDEKSEIADLKQQLQEILNEDDEQE